jgi:tRNA (cmo5U34)-methyltransferase
MTSVKNSEWQLAPRVTKLAKAFQDLASGKRGRPDFQQVQTDATLLRYDSRKITFSNVFFHYAGVFDHHYIASIPYILEENCRQGAALVRWAIERSVSNSRSTIIQSIETSEATFARSVALLSGEHVKTFSNSATKENHNTFLKAYPKNSFFHSGPFYELTKKYFARNASFSCGFDFIIEDTAFQMFGDNRLKQIRFIAQNLKEDGILLLIEKCLHPSKATYLDREKQKDREFKQRYFSPEEISHKIEILETMENGQVCFESLVDCLKKDFHAGYLIWNSGNFYSVVVSNDQPNLDRFVELLGPPCIPSEFSYEKMRRLF